MQLEINRKILLPLINIGYFAKLKQSLTILGGHYEVK